MGDNRNYILAIALSLVILIAWQYFYAIPQMERQQSIEEARQQQAGQVETGESLRPGADGTTVPSSPTTATPGTVSVPATGTDATTVASREVCSSSVRSRAAQAMRPMV